MVSDITPETALALKNWADYIVVGAGAAGSVLAARLAEDPSCKVLVIELGPNNFGDPLIETPSAAGLLWSQVPSPSALDFETTEQVGRNYHYPRGNGFGGSTNHHAMVDGRGSGKIYDKIAEQVGDNRWAYDNVLPVFKAMENYHPNPNPNPNPSAQGHDRVLRSSTKREATASFHGSSGWLHVRHDAPKSPFHRDLLQASSEVTSAPLRTDMSGDPRHVDGAGLTDRQITPSGRRASAFQDLLMPALQRPESKNVVILFNTLATRVLIRRARGKHVATGVEVLHGRRSYAPDHSASDAKNSAAAARNSPITARFVAKQEVILCGGAINTPQLLMLSGLGPKSHLAERGIPLVLDLAGVGSNLMDHREVNVNYELDASKFVWPAQAATIVDNIDKFLQKPTGRADGKVQEMKDLRERMNKFADRKEQREGAGEVVLDWYSGTKSDIGHDLHITSGEGFFFDFETSGTSKTALPDGRLRRDYELSQTDVSHPEFLRVFHHSLIEVLKFGRTDGTIRLASSDPTVSPLIDLKLHTDEEALERTARGVLMVRAIARHPLVKQHLKLDSDGNPVELFPGPQVATVAQIKRYLKRWSAFGHHISGTAKMGRDDDPMAVVNSRLQVLGIPNLRVIDTSVYPAPWLHGYNTARAAYLVGEMGAAFIKESRVGK
jgi:choline dehydrogenase